MCEVTVAWRLDARLFESAQAHPAFPPAVLHEADGLIVCNKPAHLPSTGRDLDDPDCLQALLMAHWKRKIWAVHQLDRETTGVNLFVRRRALVDTWSRHLRDGTKTYVTAVDGAWPHGAETIVAPIERVAGQPRVVREGRPTHTFVTPLVVRDDASLLSVRIATGRTHQIRLHLAHRGHPVRGDKNYGRPVGDRQLLHAWRVSCGGETWTAPVPEDLREGWPDDAFE